MMPSSIEAALDRARQRRRLPPPETRRRLRQMCGLTLEDLASALGVTIAAVSRWETGEREPRDPNLLGRYSELLHRLAQEDMRA